MLRRRECLVQHTCLAENLERRRLKRGGPRLAMRACLAFYQAGRDAVARELDRGEQTRRPRAHDQHLGPRLAHRRIQANLRCHFNIWCWSA